MLFFSPLTHDRTVYGVPVVTLGILLACTLIAAASFAYEARVATELATAEREIVAILARHPDARVGFEVHGLPEALQAQLSDELVDTDPARRPRPGDAELDRAVRRLVDVLNHLPTLRFGYRPAHASLGTLFTNVWMHGGVMHLLGNLFFLFVAGTLIESRFTRAGFLAFYVVGGAVATLAHHFVEYASDLPLVGASGAISAVLGAALFLHPRTRITFGLVLFFGFGLKRWPLFRLPAWGCLTFWGLWQVLDAVRSHGEPIAYFAHVGGFAFGLVVAAALHHLDWLETDYDTLGATEPAGP